VITSYRPQALLIAAKINTLLRQQGLRVRPAFEMWTGARETAWLSAVFDSQAIEKPERQASYEDRQLLHHLSTNLKGLPVILANHNGLRWCILLSRLPALPAIIPLPPWEKGRVYLGVGLAGPVITTWDHAGGLGNVLVASMKRQGKSTLLRSLARQALAEGHVLIVADHQGLTFWNLRGHPQVLAFGDTPDTCRQILTGALRAEIDRRAALFRQTGIDKIETLHAQGDKLPRLVVLVDEYYDLAQTNPDLAAAVHNAALSGPKYGLHVVVAGHYFDEKSVGKLKGQFETRICFRFMDAPAARLLVGNDAPLRIRLPGRAMTNRWGLIQTCAARLDDIQDPGDGLTAHERIFLVRLKTEADGLATYQALKTLGLSRSEIETLRTDWLRRGLVRVDKARGNALRLV